MKSTFKNALRIIGMFPYKYLLVLSVIFTIVLGVIEIAVSYSFKLLMDSVLNQNYAYFKNAIYIFVGLIIVNFVLSYLRNRMTGTYAAKGIKLLREKLALKTFYLPLKEIDKRHTGDVLSRLTNDMNLIQEFTVHTLIALIYNPLTAIGAFIIVLIFHWKLALICTFGIPLVISLASIASRPVSRYTRKYQEELAVMNSYVKDTISGIEIQRAFNLKESLSQKYRESAQRARSYGFKLALTRVILGLINIITGIAPFLISFGFGGYFVVKQEMTPGTLIAFINLLNPLAFPISQLPVLMGQLRGQMAGAQRVFELLDVKEERDDGTIFEPVKRGTAISFKDVSFKYNEEDQEPVLNKLNLEIKTGEKVALVGSSGSGKTTIIKLILGYYDSYQGQIEVYGHELKEWNLKGLRNYISLVSQDTYLFPGSIAENIAYGSQNPVTSDEIITAAKAANAHDFISKLKDGYDSTVGEFGDRLSGGEKQRLSIARAILKKAPILLLDEATSSLDNHSEYLVQKALDNIMSEGTTGLIIAHRLSTIQKADRILVIDQGQIVETGNHDELLARNGVYKKLYLRQLAQNETTEKEAAV